MSKEINPRERLEKLLIKRGWRVSRVGGLIKAVKPGRTAVIMATRGRVRVYIPRGAVTRLLDTRDRVAVKNRRVDAVVAARIGRRWRFKAVRISSPVIVTRDTRNTWRP